MGNQVAGFNRPGAHAARARGSLVAVLRRPVFCRDLAERLRLLCQRRFAHFHGLLVRHERRQLEVRRRPVRRGVLIMNRLKNRKRVRGASVPASVPAATPAPSVRGSIRGRSSARGPAHHLRVRRTCYRQRQGRHRCHDRHSHGLCLSLALGSLLNLAPPAATSVVAGQITHGPAEFR